MFTYKTNGVCASTINLDIVDNVIQSIEFVGGCNGNLQGIGHLVQGMKVDDVIEKLNGIHCGKRSTSCPDQLSLALLAWKEENNN
ncbi:TIGR03905 family TSCPD domain-containing protein [Clostridium sp. SM-530-WT-3G]|uniref:TIGR03905 family TSCPD domain-containing protein n=1 Tax=Clostridium sp. SM-530-WT-3G TaxID=2725303 RepID=UPI00145CFE7A|nr:TIGR03905 family TSCPD domain-containing protein [Clostridium sp. SM-530-WT-3G]NME83248.1 TIGR03905 family TSCPD domain-containing protein [Clostridium sp. SM-530-WT-3G]